MKPTQKFRQALKEAGIPDNMILQYQNYLDSGNRQGQKRLLCQFRRIQKEKLNKDRVRLACLDYIIARVEKTEELSESK